MQLRVIGNRESVTVTSYSPSGGQTRILDSELNVTFSDVDLNLTEVARVPGTAARWGAPHSVSSGAAAGRQRVLSNNLDFPVPERPLGPSRS